uniref:Uncharacterized protein n=1 Tax=Arundo donax TaxID=35708 RepID=A0A0A9BQU8_ARUDO
MAEGVGEEAREGSVERAQRVAGEGARGAVGCVVGAVGRGEQRVHETREGRGLLLLGDGRGEAGSESGDNGDEEVVAERVVGGEGEKGGEEEGEVVQRGWEEVVVDEGEE